MERLIRVKDVMERYGVSRNTARKYIKECNPHMEKPLAVTERAFEKWERERTVLMPNAITKADYERVLQAVRNGARLIVPRRR